MSGVPIPGRFAPVSINVRHAPDGAVTLSNRLPLGPYPDTLIDVLRFWATRRPAAPFLAERRPGAAGTGGVWSFISFAEMWARTEVIAARLLGVGCGPERPVLILAPNSIAHAEVMLAAMRAGIPCAPVSTAFALMSGDLARLRHVTRLVTPQMAVLPEDSQYDAAAAAIGETVGVVIRGGTWDTLPAIRPDELRRAEAAIGPSTVAKLLFTSGSTDAPKAVPNTHLMMCSNQAALAAIWPCIASGPLVLVDWLPWNHTFGGNFSFNMALTHGGTLYIDSGKPTPGLLAATLANLREVAPSLYLNVPAGFEALLPYLEADRDFARHLFSRLHLVFCAGAALPQHARERLDALSQAVRGGAVPILTGWGSTETAPCATSVYSENAVAANIGLPMPGTEVKLAPDQDKFELRVRGPNVMAGYWRTGGTPAAVFDAEGFYRMGDAGKLVDPGSPEAGIVFDGRVAENFKLRSGTWVHVGALRLAILEAGRPWVRDAVITGHDREEIGVLVFPNVAACRELAGGQVDDAALAAHPAVVARLRECLREQNRGSAGGSTHLSCFAVLATPPRAELHEITDKGYVNQRVVLKQRSVDVELLHGPSGYRV
jgi:feruloyl-CoA synthase